ncbi:peroxidase 12-like [Carya illinoinensis]|uniref:peroxidase n=1 Tax=Carya illinoinensis TaxID=32201 RepID=A0A8T1NAA7_CARIL|nr:peroxidase 12-like [Carya illinoinensis]KAG6625957.1 hypothetical protein CIPAW_15G013700 [Carya illinoinensis]
MRTTMAGFTSFPSLLLISSLLLASYGAACASKVQASVTIVDGLSWTFYNSSCPELESIVRTHLKTVFEKDIGQAAGLLRLHFHDCFVQGCDGSILLDGTDSDPSEKDASPNLTLRAKAFQIIEDLRELVHNTCGRVVSCADIVTVAARDSVYLAGGPEYSLPLGRRDGLTFASQETTVNSLPSSTSNASELVAGLANFNLNATDLVALSGAHTIGIGHCTSLTSRLYPTLDSTLDDTFADELLEICPDADSNSTTVLDIRTPNKFDNKYYINLVNRQGLFTSDQDLYMYNVTSDIVTSFALDEELFFDKFVDAMIKMGQLSVLTGEEGEIRANCSVANSDSTVKLTSAEGDQKETGSAYAV